MSWTNTSGTPIPGPTSGDDRFVGSASTDNAFAGDGADSLVGVGGGDFLSGEDGNDTLVGGSGAGGFNALYGGLGDDSIIGGPGGDFISGGNDDDTLVGGSGYGRIEGGDGDDSITDTGGGGFDIVGGWGNDTIAVTIDGVALHGMDIDGEGGNDSIVASGPGFDNGDGRLAATLYGGGDNDTIVGTDVDDPLYGGDRLYGESGNDSIVGGAGSDRIDAGSGNDTVDAGSGDDNIYATGIVSIDGGTGDDYLVLDRFQATAALGFTVDGAGALAGSEGSRAVNVEAFDINTGSGADTVIGGAGNDYASGGGGDDSLVGNAGNDLLVGDGGNDTLVGGAGYNRLFGGANDDSITAGGGDGFEVQGGAGNDTLAVTVGGGEASSVYVNGDTGHDSIVASGSGQDWNGWKLYQVALEGGDGNDTIVGTDVGESLELGDIIGGGSGDDSIVAGGGNDLIDSGAGNDRVAAGTGNDSVTWVIGDGNDTFDGGTGTDTLDLQGWNGGGANPWTTVEDAGYTVYTHGPSGAVVYARTFESVVCFAEGTRILTPRGEVPIETLRAGDLVIVASGTPRIQALRWVGHMCIDIARARDRADVAPVLIRAGALGQGVPFRDLRVSPEHGCLLDGRLVPARLLIDGDAIVQEGWCPAVTYWHLELDAHGVLVADGALSESYFDDGNRHLFDNPAVAALRPRFDRAPGSRYAREACAPPILDAAEPALLAIRRRLPARRRSA